MKIKTYVKVLLAMGLLAFGASLKAQSDIVAVGTFDGESNLEVDFRMYSYWGSGPWGGFTIYQNGDAIFIADLGGVTTCAGWLSYSVDYYGFYHFYNLNGDISIQLNGAYGGDYWYSSNEISFLDKWNTGQLYLDWF